MDSGATGSRMLQDMWEPSDPSRHTAKLSWWSARGDISHQVGRRIQPRALFTLLLLWSSAFCTLLAVPESLPTLVVPDGERGNKSPTRVKMVWPAGLGCVRGRRGWLKRSASLSGGAERRKEVERALWGWRPLGLIFGSRRAEYFTVTIPPLHGGWQWISRDDSSGSSQRKTHSKGSRLMAINILGTAKDGDKHCWNLHDCYCGFRR